MATAAELGYQILEIARRWRKARIAMREVLDRRSASKADIASAKREYNELMDKLEALVGRLEALAQGRGIVRKKGKPFPWKELFGAAAVGIQTLSDVIGQVDGLASGTHKPKGRRVVGRVINQDGSVEADITENDE